MIAIDTRAADDVIARLAALPNVLRARLGVAIDGVSDALYGRVIDMLQGEVVKSRTGRLTAAITQTPGELSVGVGLDTSIAPYGPALEFGASIPAQLIEAKNGKTLSFMVGGRRVFAKQVMRPAFTLPPHSFLRAALTEMSPALIALMDDAVSEGIEG